MCLDDYIMYKDEMIVAVPGLSVTFTLPVCWISSHRLFNIELAFNGLLHKTSQL